MGHLQQLVHFQNNRHRIGRTARHDKGGMAITLYIPAELEEIESIKRELKVDIKPSKFKEFNYQMKIERRFLRTI